MHLKIHNSIIAIVL